MRIAMFFLYILEFLVDAWSIFGILRFCGHSTEFANVPRRGGAAGHRGRRQSRSSSDCLIRILAFEGSDSRSQEEGDRPSLFFSIGNWCLHVQRDRDFGDCIFRTRSRGQQLASPMSINVQDPMAFDIIRVISNLQPRFEP